MAGKRKFSILRIAAATVLIAVMIVTAAGCQSGTEEKTPSTEEIAKSEAREAAKVTKVIDYTKTDYTVDDTADGNIILKNRYDGYELTLPGDYKDGIDVSAAAAKAGNAVSDVSIFSEQFKSEAEFASYRGYSNKPIKESENYTVGKDSKDKQKDRIVYRLSWSRNALSRVENDKPYYCCVDILYLDQTIPKDKGQYLVYTLYFRSAGPIDENMVNNVVSSFKMTDRKERPLTNKPKNADQTLNIRPYWADSTRKFYEDHFSRDAADDWGIYQYPAPSDMNELNKLEKKVDYKFDILVRYCHFGGEDGDLNKILSDLDKAADDDRYLELTLQTSEDKKENQVYRILNGEYDEYLRNLAYGIRDRQQPVLMRFLNEMNGDWCAYSAYNYGRDTDLFIQAYRYVYNIFTECGAQPYTIWVWNPNEKSLPGYKWNHEYQYYPGDDYVDVVGLTGYNTGNYYEGEIWRTFNEIYKKPYLQDVVNYSQPLMITEFASSSVGGNKVKWMENMFSELKSYDRIKIAVWWNGRDLDKDGKVARPYWFNENKSTLAEFRKGLEEN